MAVDYNDERFAKVESEKNVALSEVEKTYGGMIDKVDDYYQAQIDASKDWAEKQQQLQQEKTDFAIEKIEQQKDQAKKDYIKEQSGAYVDWQKQSNPYGVDAEQKASMGLANSGYSESSQVSMYNTYQNRVSAARESYNLAVLNYNNSIKDAQLQNNSVLAEIAYKSLQQQLELSLQGFQYKNQLILEQANKKTEIDTLYYNRYQDVVNQINTENALAEQQRQYNESLAFQKQQAADNKTIQEAQLALQREQFNWQKAQASSGSGGTIKKSSSSGSSKKSSSKKSSSKKSSSSKKKISNNTGAWTGRVETYSEAASLLQKKGATNGDGGLMTKSEWQRRKGSGSNRAEASYSSYTDYLNSFVAWRLANPE